MNFWKTKPEAKPEPVQDPAVLKKSSAEGRYAKTREEKIASKEATRTFNRVRFAAVTGYVPKGAAFQIRQVPAGHFEIHRLHVRPAFSPDDFGAIALMDYREEYLQKASLIEARSTDPIEIYEAVKNTDAPIMTTAKSYGRGPYDVPSLSGYAVLAFNVFADAEAYLFRMAQPSEVTTDYDFPPLKKRAVKRPKTEKAQ